jgi:hypothetical protein
MGDNEMPQEQSPYEKAREWWQFLKERFSTSPGVADYGWVPSEEGADASQGSEEPVRDAFTEGVMATPGSLGYGSDSTIEGDQPTYGVADYGWVPSEEGADASQGSEEPVRDAFTEGVMATPGSLGYGGDINVFGVAKAVVDALPHGIGDAFSTINDAVKTMHKPQYMTDGEWNEKQTPLIKSLDRFGKWLQEISPLQEYEPNSNERLAQTITVMVPTVAGLALAALAGMKSGNSAAVSQSGEYAAMRMLGGAAGAAKNNPQVVKLAESLANRFPAISKVAANAPAVLSSNTGKALENVYLQSPTVYMQSVIAGNSAYKEAIKAGLSHEKAERVREDAVRLNAGVLAGLKAIEPAASFIELPYSGPVRILKNTLGEGARYAVSGMQSAGEEFFQENIKRLSLMKALDREISNTDVSTPEGIELQKRLLAVRGGLSEVQWNLLKGDDALKEQIAAGFGNGMLFRIPGSIDRVGRGDFSKRVLNPEQR